MRERAADHFNAYDVKSSSSPSERDPSVGAAFPVRQRSFIPAYYKLHTGEKKVQNIVAGLLIKKNLNESLSSHCKGAHGQPSCGAR